MVASSPSAKATPPSPHTASVRVPFAAGPIAAGSPKPSVPQPTG